MANQRQDDTIELQHLESPNIRIHTSNSVQSSTSVNTTTKNNDTTSNNNTMTNQKQSELPQSRFLQHMATYPAVAAAVGFTASFPVVKIFASNAVPLLMSFRNRDDAVSKRANEAIDRADKYGDQLLDRVDQRFPQLKTAQPNELAVLAQQPLRNARTTANVYSDAARRSLSTRVVGPMKRAVQAARKQYARVYDTQGKALMRSQFDPIIGPLNNRIEGVIIDYIPGEGELDDFSKISNEFSRTWRLGRAAFRRGVPAIRDQASYLSDFPNAAGSRLREIYSDRRQTHSNGRRGATLAAIGTSRQATTESAQFLRQLQNQMNMQRQQRRKQQQVGKDWVDGDMERVLGENGITNNNIMDDDDENHMNQYEQPPVSIVDNDGNELFGNNY